MAASKRATPEPPPGDTWLASCARRPELVHEVWEMGGLAPIHCTRRLAAEAQLGTALQAVKRITSRERGPLLLDPGLDTAWWLVPPDGSGRVTDPVDLAAAFGPGGGPRLPAEAFG